VASEVGTAYVALLPSAKGFAAKMQAELAGDIARIGKSGGDDYGESFSDAAKRSVDSRSRKMFGGMAKAATGALAAVGIGSVLKGSIDAAADLGETMSKSSQIFGDEAIPQLERFADKASTGLGQSKQQALDAAATFATFGKSAGLAGDDLVGFSTDFTTLASDLASFHNAEPQEAIDAIGAALRGEAEPMRRFGVLLDDASMRTEAMRLGIVKTTKTALTPQQKVLAAQALMFKQTKDAQGDFARTSDGLSNRQRILRAELENSKVALGNGLLPVVNRMAGAAVKLMPKVQSLAGTIGDKLGPAFDDAAGYVKDLWPSVKQLATQVGDILVPAAENAFAAAKDLFGFFAEHQTTTKVLAGALGALVAVTYAHQISMRLAAFSVKSWVVQTRIAQAVTKAWAAVQWLLNAAMSANPIMLIVIAVAALIAVVVLIVRKFGLWEKITRGIGAAFEWVKGAIGKAWNGIKSGTLKGVDAVVGFVKSLPDKAKRALSSLAGAIGGVVSKAWDKVDGIVDRGVDAVVNGVKALPGKVRKLGGAFLDAGRHLIGQLVDGLKKAGGVVADIAGNVWNGVKDMLNDALGRIDAALTFTVKIPGPLPDINFNAPIPRLAGGGRAAGATLAMIGEGREPETVLPDSMLRGLLERTAAEARGGVAQLTITNWEQGTGYLRLIADDAVNADATFRRNVGAMH
jgi:hypothetical protein